MLGIEGASGLRRIVVLNPKGGAGKTTLAFNIAGYLALSGRKVALIDLDQQGSSSHWLDRRSAELPEIHGVCASSAKFSPHINLRVTLPPHIDLAVVDSPAGVSPDELADFTAGSHAIIVPVMPSELDIHAAAHLIEDLLLVAHVSRENRRLGVIANRVKERTIAYGQLMKFLDRLSIPVIGVIRDSQNYVSAAREGLCIHELPRFKAGKDLERWGTITQWLEQRLAMPLNERDLRPTMARPRSVERARRSRWKPATATALMLIAFAALLWSSTRSPDTDAVVSPATAMGRPAHDVAGDSRLSPESDSVATVAEELPALPDAVAAGTAVPVDSPVTESGFEEREPSSTPETLRQKWQLSGVVQSGGVHLVLLTDRSDSSTRRVTEKIDVDGWLVKDAGRDFAVLAKDGEEVRLELSKRDADWPPSESR